ncbi:AsmA-like C-terminal region-containing protein [Flavobacterium stagni]|uniref:AsmA family protein n=1 Tax=Flavobacterium stagni TaxID=2506421 RepID=A0A4Q1KAS2_9FLAO|nr:AsmA-like C-terminal region-containing protein [Flavobacterium stagni]RXR24012.1 AsmA family protein [Flavobacterium stagni]
MLKKIAKITGITLGVIVLLAFAIPYFFKDQIKARIEKALNESVDAKVSFADAEVSLFKNFPKATVSVEKMSIINKAPFEGDTLVAFDELHLKLSVMELFNSDTEPMHVDAISTNNGLINIIFNEKGQGNYDIALKDKKETDSGEASKPLSLKIKEYEVENYTFRFTDRKSKIKMQLDSINHTGEGDFNNDVLDLKTKTTTQVSMSMDKMNYMNHVPVALDAVLGIDLKQSKYSFKQNEAKINDLPLKFNGFIQMAENAQIYDLTFETPTSDFKNFLGLIPAAYRSNLDNVKTTGAFSVKGFAKGQLTETTVPKFNIGIASNNASFQYPNLPKAIKNIHIDTKIVNETGTMNDTYVNIDRLSFAIDQDVFTAKATLKNVAENAQVNAELKGTINLNNFSKAYPIKLDKPLSGILKADVTTAFDMASVEKSDYARIQNAGTIDLTGFRYTDETGKNMDISKVLVEFNPSRVHLKQFAAKTGKSDLAVNGVLENFYGFIFRNQNLQGNFNLTSNQLAVNDFMTTETTPKTESKKAAEPLKIPAFLDCSLTAKANTVLYDNLTLKNCMGKLIIKDQKVTLENVKTNIFNGQITFNGDVSTKEKTPKFAMNLGLSQVDIAQSFTQLEMLKKIAPIAGVINGKLNSTIKLNGNLNATEMTPDIKSLSGDLIGQLLSTTVNPSNSKLLNTLDDQLKFIDINKLNLNDLKAAVSFKDGKVVVKPFDIKYQDIKVTVNGSHGFDQSMNYGLKLDVPAKYLGNDANKLLAKLSPSDVNKLDNVPINANLTGSFSNPKVTTDIKTATTALANNIAKQQKDKLVGKGKSALDQLIDRNTKPGDTAKTKTKEDIKNKAGNLINGLFGKKK